MSLADLVGKREELKRQLAETIEQNQHADRKIFFADTYRLERQIADVEALILLDDEDAYRCEMEWRQRQVDADKADWQRRVARLPKLEDTLRNIREYFGGRK